MTKQPDSLNLEPLAPYEDRLLAALAFFRTKRQLSTQARHCLSMYLRQSEARIMGEVGFYAGMVDMTDREFLELIYEDPAQAEELIKQATGVDISGVFSN